MAKELPYFRFTPQEWQNKDISLLSLEHKGLFIDICSWYWLKDCSITKAMLELKYNNKKELLKDFYDYGIINVDNNNEFIEINFLNDQFDILSNMRKARQKAGSKGGKQKSSNAKAMLKQKSSYKYKDKDKEIEDIYKVQYFKTKEINEPFIEYLLLRKKMKLSNSSAVIKRLENKLREYSDNNKTLAIEIIMKAITGKWKDFYSLKNN